MLEAIPAAARIDDGDLLLIVADKRDTVSAALAALRAAPARELKLIDDSKYVFCWVTEFPLFGFDEAAGPGSR